MSRSYREPIFTCGYGSKSKQFEKRQANKRIRKSENVPDGKVYKKFYNPWNICDCRIRWNPYPITYCYKGEIKIVEPIPEWRARRK